MTGVEPLVLAIVVVVVITLASVVSPKLGVAAPLVLVAAGPAAISPVAADRATLPEGARAGPEIARAGAVPGPRFPQRGPGAAPPRSTPQELAPLTTKNP